MRRITPFLALAAIAAACAPAAVQVDSPATVAPTPSLATPALPAPAPIAAAEYAARRAAVADAMEDGVLLVLGAPVPQFDYLPFHQRADFRYLTGITEPGAALVIEKRDGRVEQRVYVLPRDPTRETWEGRRLGPDGASALLGIPAAAVDRLTGDLDAALARARRLYLLGPAPRQLRPGAILGHEQQVVRALLERHDHPAIADLAPRLYQLRAAKSPAEIDLLRRAIHITNLGHAEAMRAVAPGMNEFEIQALFEYTFRRLGAEGTGYESIVGAGPNSTTLHYNQNDRFMRDGEVLLFDVGARYRGYTADITRTVPVNGTFTPEQREIYTIVLEAQKAAERLVRPGAAWPQLDQAAERVLADGLARLGLIDSPTATYRCESARFGVVCPQYRLWYMHGLGHGIGLHVHDPDPSHIARFDVGSIFTIEPGIYIRADALDHLPDTPENRAMIERLRPAQQRYLNIGVRIEDNYLLTDTGLVRLSEPLPREIDDIEALMQLPARPGAPRAPEIIDWYRSTEPAPRP